MWKVLIVEDEIFVRESIIEIIEWEEYGFNVVDEAGDGVEALEIIKENEPDLIITDILMPVMDGVDLLKTARQKGVESLFVMLSCLNDFEYVRQAMEFGASNYILKLSMDIESLKKTLEKINIDLIKRKYSYTKEIDKQYQYIWDKIKQNSFIIEGIDDLLVPFSFLNDFKLIIFSVLHGDCTFNEKYFWDLNLVSYDQDAVIHLFNQAGQTTVFYWTNKEIQIDLCVIERHNYKIVQSEQVVKDEMVETWQQILRQLDAIWYEKEVPYYMDDLDQRTFWNIDQGLFLAFKEMNQEKFLRLLVRKWKMEEKSALSMALVKERSVQLVVMIKNITNTKKNINNYINNCTTYFKLKEYVSEFLIYYFKQNQRKLGVFSEHPEINKILHYIQQNYQKELTVQILASKVAMADNYLSSLFKKQTGETLINYIHKVRIKKAKTMLVQTDLTVGKIAEKVGFMNNNYFIKIFKRLTAETPKSYREKNA